MTRVTIVGAHGRMGMRIGALADLDSDVEIVGRVGRDAPTDALPACDVVIDFSTPDGTRFAAQHARDTGAALLVGTTGLSAEIHRELGDLARSSAVMIAPNTSLGVAVLCHLAAEAARMLGPGFDLDIVESHHTAKKDAPSGTALRVADVMRERAGRAVDADHVHAIRAGTIVGEHEIRFSGPNERLSIVHTAGSRDIFARGALRLAGWLNGREPGAYTVESALF